MTRPNDEYLSALHYVCQKHNVKLGISSKSGNLHHLWLSLPWQLWRKNFANGKYILRGIYDNNISVAAQDMLEVLRKEYGVKL